MTTPTRTTIEAAGPWFQAAARRGTLLAGLALAAATALAAAAPAALAETDGASQAEAPAEAGSANPNPYARPDDTWISISGTVTSVAPDSFVLDFGEGTIIVEMDDGDRDADGYKLLEGDKVTVNGMVDDDFYETTTIEAGSVYVERLGTTFFASTIDEEDFVSWTTITLTPVVIPYTVIQGTVTSVSDDEFVVNTGLRSMRVEVEGMPYNPLDDEGYQKVRVGDVVRVTGEIDDDFFEGREMEANSVVKIRS